MSKTIQRPPACRNAHCGAMCTPAQAEFWDWTPHGCPHYERRDDLYMDKAIPLEKVKQAREEMEKASYTESIDDVLEILDKLISESEG